MLHRTINTAEALAEHPMLVLRLRHRLNVAVHELRRGVG